MALDPKSLLWDYLVFAAFVLFTTCAPLWTKRKKAGPISKKDYVFGSGSGAGVLAMILSITRGMLGVKSFLGLPSELFYRGSAMWETMYGMMLAYPIVCFVFVPVYYSLGITSVYQYLDLRFKSRTVRCLASATFIWRQLLNLGVIVFTPCVALNTVVGIPHYASIIGIVSISICFTVLGGLKAAIKADVIQSVTMILLSLAIIIQGSVEVGGPKQVVEANVNDGRLKFFNFTWDMRTRVDTMSAVFGQLFMSLSVYGCQQTFVQRYCSMSSEKKVRKTLMLNIPAILVLFSLSWIVGMVIYSVFQDCDPMTSGYIKKMDEILPFYIEDKFNFMPGLLGLFLGSLFNGALSFLVSNLNSLATVTWEDFVSQAPAFKDVKDQQQVIIIKIIGALYAIVIMGISFAVGLLSGVIESSLLMTSATSGPLLGVFILAMLVPCANKYGAIAGMVSSHVVSTWMAIGHVMYSMNNREILPLSTGGCTNDTFLHSIHKPLVQWPQVPLPIEIPHNATDPAYWNPHHNNEISQSISPMYAMSYMYYAVFGTMICVIVGTVVSLIFRSKDQMYDEHLVHPIALNISRKFPGKRREYFNEKGAVKSEKTRRIVEVDNHAFTEVDLNGNNDAKCVIETERYRHNIDDSIDSITKKDSNQADIDDKISEVSSSRHFENYDSNTRNNFKGDRNSFKPVFSVAGSIVPTISSLDNEKQLANASNDSPNNAPVIGVRIRQIDAVTKL